MNIKEASLRYLGPRRRTRLQVEEYLLKKEFEREDISEEVNQLMGLGYIDDVVYAFSYYNYAMEKGYGYYRARGKLRALGVSSEDFEEAYEQICQENPEDFERDRTLVQGEKIIRGKQLDEKLLAKVERKLNYQGFPSEDIYFVMDKLKRLLYE